MKLLITPREVAEIAFEGQYGISPERIGEAPIISAQQKFIRPALGGLYRAIEQDRYPELEPLLKPVLAQYVKLLLIPQIAVSMGDMGITQTSNTQLSPPATKSIAALRNTIRAAACTLMRNMIEQIELNRENYPEYDPAENILKRVSICSGIIL